VEAVLLRSLSESKKNIEGGENMSEEIYKFSVVFHSSSDGSGPSVIVEAKDRAEAISKAAEKMAEETYDLPFKSIKAYMVEYDLSE